MVTRILGLAGAALTVLTMMEAVGVGDLVPLGGNHIYQHMIVLGAAFVIIEVWNSVSGRV